MNELGSVFFKDTCSVFSVVRIKVPSSDTQVVAETNPTGSSMSIAIVLLFLIPLVLGKKLLIFFGSLGVEFSCFDSISS